MSTYDKVAKSIDAINDIIIGNVSDQELGEIMRLEAQILGDVAASEEGWDA